MAQQKVAQPRSQAIQSFKASNSESLYQRMSTAKTPKFKDAVWPRHGTETAAQLGRLLRGKLPK